MQRHLFICHSSQDASLARGLVREIEKRGQPCWYSGRNSDNPPGTADDLEACAKAVESCACFALIVTRHSIRSEYVNKELKMAFEDKKPIIVLKGQSVSIPSGWRMIITGIQYIRLDQHTTVTAAREAVAAIQVACALDGKEPPPPLKQVSSSPPARNRRLPLGILVPALALVVTGIMTMTDQVTPEPINAKEPGPTTEKVTAIDSDSTLPTTRAPSAKLSAQPRATQHPVPAVEIPQCPLDTCLAEQAFVHPPFPDGYNVHGIDIRGLDKSGYDREGYSLAGFDQSGFDRLGFDADGQTTNGIQARLENGMLFIADHRFQFQDLLASRSMPLPQSVHTLVTVDWHLLAAHLEITEVALPPSVLEAVATNFPQRKSDNSWVMQWQIPLPAAD